MMNRLLLSWLVVIAGIAPASARQTPSMAEFHTQVRPILERRCLACHGGKGPRGGLSVESRESLVEGGKTGPALRPESPLESPLLLRVLEQDARRRMPRNQAPLPDDEVAVLRHWLEEGAPWPAGFTLVSPKERSLALVPPPVPEVPAKFAGHLVDRFLYPWCVEQGVEFSRADDRDFIRRVHFDLTGLPPNFERIARFVADPSPDKDRALVEELLSDRRAYAEHWMNFWNDLLRNAYRGTGFIDNGRQQITEWLYRSLYEGRHYDDLVRDLLTGANGAEGFLIGIRWRGVVNASQQPALQVAQGVSKVFFGTKLECASCHDSFVDPWKLEDAYSFAALFAEGPLEIYRCDHPTGQFAEPRFLYPQLGSIAPDLPRGERLRAVADLVVSPKNGRLAKTIVQRLWARLFGRGLVEPLDDLDQPSWNPALLEALAVDLVEHDYDLEHSLATICTSRAYRAPAGWREVFTGPLSRRLSAEEFVDALAVITGTGPALETSARQVDGRGQGGQWRAALRARTATDALTQNAPPRPKWIWNHADAARSDPGGSFWFARDFDVPEEVHSAGLVGSCDNEFIAFVDEVEVLRSAEWQVAASTNIAAALTPGHHRLTVLATNWPDLGRGLGVDNAPGSPAGLLLALLVSGQDGAELLRIVSDESWTWSPDHGSTPVTPDSESFPASVIAALEEGPWHLDESFGSAFLQESELSGTVRACLLDDDALLRALGRPSREQWVTQRDAKPTLLGALELVNGEILATQLRRAAANWIEEGLSLDETLERLFTRALGREPRTEERAIAVEICAKDESGAALLQADALADLMWSVVMLPEFQFLR